MATAESAAASVPEQTAMPQATLALPDIYRITVDEYERIDGVIADPHVELIDGCLVKTAGKKPPHSWSVQQISDAIFPMLPSPWVRRQEQPVRIPDFDEPEPDVAIVRGPNDAYRNRHPGPGDVTLLIEVSESTVARDRAEKLRAYAKGKVVTYWIVNLVDRCVELYTGPGPNGCAPCVRLTAEETVPVTIEGDEVGRIAVSEILP
jgi:Uma2 family endonuclease